MRLLAPSKQPEGVPSKTDTAQFAATRATPRNEEEKKGRPARASVQLSLSLPTKRPKEEAGPSLFSLLIIKAPLKRIPGPGESEPSKSLAYKRVFP